MKADEWGDFQTPPALASEVLATLGSGWSRALEPTCGTGSFLTAGQSAGIQELIGIEVRQSYAAAARMTGSTILSASIFDLDLASDLHWSSDGPLLVVGNPPWVTSSQLGSLGSTNLPPKSNLRRLRGIDAMTGSSNFDIAEFILLKVASELVNERPTVSMLCKTQVARNVMEFAHRNDLVIDSASIRKIDAKSWFGANVDACLFTFRVGHTRDLTVPIFETLQASEPIQRLGFVDGRMVADLDAHTRSAFADGLCPFEWRQGVKHDAAAVMEVTRAADGKLHTRSGDPVDVEADWVFPLLKSTALYHAREATGAEVIVTQRSLGDDTNELAQVAPKLWAYLSEHADQLNGRKSSIYRNRGPFTMFGIGDYTFAPWKVAVSGLHKEIRFRLIGPANGRPVLFDDTCYLLPFSRGEDAALAAALCCSEVAADLLASLSFPDAKRPVTKRLLARIDLAAIAGAVDVPTTLRSASTLLDTRVTPKDWDRFCWLMSAESGAVGPKASSR
jgi:hypothetical protein